MQNISKSKVSKVIPSEINRQRARRHEGRKISPNALRSPFTGICQYQCNPERLGIEPKKPKLVTWAVIRKDPSRGDKLEKVR